MRALGIDPGTSRWAFAFLEDGKLAEEAAIPSAEIKKRPEKVLDFTSRADLTVAPSGYGRPVKRVSKLSERDFFEILLRRGGDSEVMGLERVLRLLKKERVNAHIIPGVKLLPTVPKRRKKGKIDMGTPDKLCVAIAGIVDQTKRLGISYNHTSFVLAEIGAGFDAFLAVKDGQIVDGIGGTISSGTWRGRDGEIMYLRGELRKADLLKDKVSVDVIAKGAINDIRKLREECCLREVLVSGSKSEMLLGLLKYEFKSVRRLESCGSSNAAYGAAIIADGLAGGRYEELVDLVKIKEAKGSNLYYTGLKYGDFKRAGRGDKRD